MLHSRRLSILLLALPLAACGRVKVSRDSDAPKTIHQQVEAANLAMTTAFNRGDYQAAAQWYSDDARIIGPNGERVSGRAAIDRYWMGLPPKSSWKLEVLEVGGSPESPWQLGRSTLTMPGRDGGAARVSIVDFVGVWKKQPDGTLKLYIDMWNPAPRSSGGN